jgi:integrase
MTPFLEHVLEQHHETTLYKEPTHYVFCREDGSPLDPDHMRNYILYPAMDAAKIERQKRGSGLHMFRHTAGSVVYALTGDLEKAQDQLGHADIQTTGKFYVHTDDAQKEAAASALELAFAADLQSAFTNLLPGPATQSA